MTNEIINSFIDAMTKSGCQPNKQSDINPEGKDNYYRIKGDKKDNRGGYCLTIESDGFAYGNFINFRTQEKGKWNSKGEFKGLSDEEREAIDDRIRATEQKRAKAKSKLHDLVAAKAGKELKTFVKATVKNEYLKNKEIKPYNAKVDGDDLIIPMVSHGKIWGYQRILPDGSKYFITDGKKQGCYCPLVKPSDDKSIILVCEGFATGSTIRSATDLPTYAAFDAGNLLPVVTQLKEQYPESRIIICADNDHATKIRGKLVNTGLIKAQQAAAKNGGAMIVYPTFDDDVKEGNSDFNDLYLMEGLSAVKDKILPVVANKGKVDVEASVVQDGEKSTPSPDEFGDYGLPFRVLGYKDGTYFYYSFGQKEIIKLNAGGHTLMNLLQLATLEQWENLFINSPTAKIPLLAANKLFATAKRRGFFKEDDRIRGTGVWKDAGRLIVNCGNKIYMDSVEIEFHEIVSKYVYVTGSKMPSLVVGDIDTDFTVLRKIFCMPTWDNPASGVLLAGWIVIAPLCSALPFRPHIFLTGQSGSGKSTIIDMIKKTLDGISLNKDGTSSEASIRSSMGYNARPIIFDEAEGDGTKVTSMDAVLSLARLSSSGGTIDKYGQNEFKAQSPFCFSAVNPPIKKSSDESRISLMVLKKNRSKDAKEHFRKICQLEDKYLTKDFAKQLMTYTIRNVNTVMKNINILYDILRDTLSDPRAAQQISHMLAGYHLLGSSSVLTNEEAVELVDMHDWSDHTAVREDSDPKKLISYLSLSLVKVNCGMTTGMRDVQIGELIVSSLGEASIAPKDMATETLTNYSIKVEKGMVIIGNKNQNLKTLLKNTDWSGSWKRNLEDVDGAIKVKSKYFSKSDKQNAVGIPLRHFIGGDDEGEEIDFD